MVAEPDVAILEQHIKDSVALSMLQRRVLVHGVRASPSVIHAHRASCELPSTPFSIATRALPTLSLTSPFLHCQCVDLSPDAIAANRVQCYTECVSLAQPYALRRPASSLRTRFNTASCATPALSLRFFTQHCHRAYCFELLLLL